MQRNTLHDISVHIIAMTCLLVVATGGFIAGRSSQSTNESTPPQIHSFGSGPELGGAGPNLPETLKRKITPMPPDAELDRPHPPTR